VRSIESRSRCVRTGEGNAIERSRSQRSRGSESWSTASSIETGSRVLSGKGSGQINRKGRKEDLCGPFQ
jgi:hypothetical protein